MNLEEELTSNTTPTTTSIPSGTVTLMDTTTTTLLSLNQAQDHEQQPPTLLSDNAARMITTISTATRFSLRFSALVMEIFFETAKYSALTSMGLSRRALITAISSARKQYLTSEERALICSTRTGGGPEEGEGEEESFRSVMDKCTNLGIYVVHHTFTLAELFAMSGFHFFSNSMKNGLWAAEESVRVLDGLFGSTETSRALASVVMLVRRELFEDEDFPLGQERDRKKLLAGIAKTLTAFACLQAVTHQRNSESLKYTLKYRGFVPLKALELNDSHDTKTPEPKCTSSYKETRSCELGLMGINSPQRKIRRSQSFSFAPTQGCEFSSGLVELFDQSSDLGKGKHSRIGEQALFDFLPTRAQTSAASSPPLSPVPSPVGLVDPTSCSKDFIPQDNNFIPLIYRFMRYSTAAYGSQFIRLLGMASWEEGESHPHHPNIHSFSKHTSLPIESILYTSYSNVNATFSSGRGGILEPASMHPLVHYVTVDHGVRAIVLTCRGTLGISDALTDLTCDYDPVQVGDRTFLAHSGILSTARSLADPGSEVHAVICKALETYPEYGLALTGHSLGGGVVSLISMLWAKRKVDSLGTSTFVLASDSMLPAGRPVHCFTYGCPSITSYEGSIYLRGLVTSIVNQGDVVPNLSLGIVKDFKNVVTTLADEENLVQQIITRSLGISDRLLNASASTPLLAHSSGVSALIRPLSASDDWFWSLIKTMRADMQNEKLYPPGDIYMIDSCTSPIDITRVSPHSRHPESTGLKRSFTFPSHTCHSSVQCMEVTLKRCEEIQDHFGELNFSRTMFSSHSPRNYEDSLKALVTSLNLGQDHSSI